MRRWKLGELRNLPTGHLLVPKGAGIHIQLHGEAESRDHAPALASAALTSQIGEKRQDLLR